MTARDTGTGERTPRIGMRARRFGRDRRGVAAIEFALLGLPFMMIIFALLETALVFLGEVTLDHAVERVARQVRTGEIQSGGAAGTGMTAVEFREEICGSVDFLFDCSKLKIDLRAYGNYAVPTNRPVVDGRLDTSNFGYALPGRQTITALKVYYEWPLHLDFMRRAFSSLNDGHYLMSSIAAFRTEPF